MNQKGYSRVNAIRVAFLLVATLLCSVCLARAQVGGSFADRDVFVSLKNGLVQWRGTDGTLKGTLVGSNDGHAEGMGFDANMNLFVTHLYGAGALTGNTVDKFDSSGTLLGTFGSGYDCNPKSIVFDSAGNAYVGQADCNRHILKFNSSGALLASFAAAIENRGTDWIELAPDGCTLYYTSQGPNVKRFNVCTGTQLSNFNTAPLPDSVQGGQALRVLPDGGLLVANFSTIARLDAGGNLVQTYDSPTEWARCWLGLDLDLENDGKTAFWTTNFCTSSVVLFDLASGVVLRSFNTETPSGTVKAVKVKPAPPSPGPTVVPPICGFMTGGGSVFTTEGKRVTHGFELWCDPTRKPNNLQINWGPGNRFHLETLTTAACSDDPTISPDPPPAGFDTYRGTGSGRYNGLPGATAEWTFTDAGEPGKEDMATITIKDALGNVVLFVAPNKLTFGNHQAHNRNCK